MSNTIKKFLYILAVTLFISATAQALTNKDAGIRQVISLMGEHPGG